MHNVLVIYCQSDYPMRATIRDHLYAFRQHSQIRTFYVNVYFQSLPAALQTLEFDLIIFHTIFLSLRWTPQIFWQYVQKL
ncbi:MAG: hypothetical protein ACAI44_12185, partial [Candidatus Sericytochromatia bacterium]